MLHKALGNCVGSQVVRSGSNLGDAEIVIHEGYYAFHEFTSLVISKYESRE